MSDAVANPLSSKPLRQFRYNLRIRQRRRITCRTSVGQIFEQASHDFATTGFRKIGGQNNALGFGDGADDFADVGT